MWAPISMHDIFVINIIFISIKSRERTRQNPLILILDNWSCFPILDASTLGTAFMNVCWSHTSLHHPSYSNLSLLGDVAEVVSSTVKTLETNKDRQWFLLSLNSRKIKVVLSLSFVFFPLVCVRQYQSETVILYTLMCGCVQLL